MAPTPQKPSAGRLADVALPSLLHQLHASAATGMLQIKTRAGEHQVYVREGFPVTVQLPGSAEMLGKILHEMGALDEATYKATLAEAPPKDHRYGETLLEKNLITDQQLRLALKAQVRRKLHRLFFLTEGDFRFWPGEHDQGQHHAESLRVQPARAIYQGVRSAWGADRLLAALQPLNGKAFRCPLEPDQLARYGMGAEEARVGDLLRKGHWTLSDLVDASGLQPAPVHAAVYALLVTEVLDIRGADEVPRLRKRAPEPGAPEERPPASATPARGAAASAPSAPERPPDVDTMRKLFDSKARVVETENLFDVLGVPQTATRDEIKRAYFDAARRFHPDRLASMGLEALRPEVEKIFRRVSEAYGTLFDDARREQYVATLGDPNAAVDAGAKMMALLEAEGALRRGDMLLSKNDFAGAVREYEKAVEGSPEEGEHLGMLAWARLCARQIDLPAAQRLLQEALRQSPKCGRLHHYYGMTLKGDDSDRAAASFRRALELDKRLLASEQELRLMDMRAGRGPQKPAEPPPKKGGLFGRFRKG